MRVCVCVCACVRACVCVCARVCVRVCACVHVSSLDIVSICRPFSSYPCSHSMHFEFHLGSFQGQDCWTCLAFLCMILCG